MLTLFINTLAFNWLKHLVGFIVAIILLSIPKGEGRKQEHAMRNGNAKHNATECFD